MMERRASPRRGAVQALILLPALAMLAVGCTPKRVVAPPGTDAGQVPRQTPPPDRGAFTPHRTPPRTFPPPVVVGPADEPDSLMAWSGEAVDEPAPPSGPAADKGRLAAALAHEQLGKPYQWGATGPERFDCSGLVQFVYGNLGVSLPRVSGRQAGSGRHVDRGELRPGDLVFFSVRSSRIDHVGIYQGRHRFVHAPGRSSTVRIDRLDDPWWSQRYRGARRVLPDAAD